MINFLEKGKFIAVDAPIPFTYFLLNFASVSLKDGYDHWQQNWIMVVK